MPGGLRSCSRRMRLQSKMARRRLISSFRGRAWHRSAYWIDRAIRAAGSAPIIAELPKPAASLSISAKRFQRGRFAMRALAAFPIAPFLLFVLSVVPERPAAAQAAAPTAVAQTPPMGWNSWNYFAEKVDD